MVGVSYFVLYLYMCPGFVLTYYLRPSHVAQISFFIIMILMLLFQNLYDPGTQNLIGRMCGSPTIHVQTQRYLFLLL